MREVKGKATGDYGHPLEMVTPEKRRRLRRAAETWFSRHPECRTLDCRFEVVAIQGRRLERVIAEI
ncbi:MAG: YraN family protein [Gaiellaceae bacterium]